MQRKRSSIPLRSGSIEFLKINAAPFEWRDSYHLVLSLTWPQFAVFLLASYLFLNTFFAGLYVLKSDSVAGIDPGSFVQAWFFSVETLATVGYGHSYPATLYGHIMVTIEIFFGMIWLAVITGLIFVRFSRPTARIVFSKPIVIGSHNRQPTLMFRVANLRHTSMVDAHFSMMFSREERVPEGEEVRRFYNLKVYPAWLIRFPAALTIRHTIDESSPLHGETAESLAASSVFFVAQVRSVERVMAATVQSEQDYTAGDLRWGERFADIYEELPDGKMQVDYGRIDETEPVPTVSQPASNGSVKL